MTEFTLFDNAVLSDIPEINDDDVSQTEQEVSMESVAAVTATEVVDDQLTNAEICAKPAGVTPQLIQYTISPLPSGTGKMVTFFLNMANLTDVMVNQFVMLSDVLVKPEDVLFVHLNSIFDVNEAVLVYNAIKDCKAKAKIGNNPYTLNTASFYPLLACTYIMPTRYGYAKFDSCSVIAGGAGHLDAKNAYEFDLGRKTRLLKAVHDAGFLPDDALKYILEVQGCYSLYGAKLQEAVQRWNMSHRRPAGQPVETQTSIRE